MLLSEEDEVRLNACYTVYTGNETDMPGNKTRQTTIETDNQPVRQAARQTSILSECWTRKNSNVIEKVILKWMLRIVSTLTINLTNI